MKNLISLDNVSVSLAGTRVLHDISWRLRKGESWAVLGENGAGKSTLLSLIRGDLWPEPGCGRREYNFDGTPSRSPLDGRRYIARVSAEHQTSYVLHELSISALEATLSGLGDMLLLGRHPTQREYERAVQVLEIAGAVHLRDRALKTLSQGELRKVLISRALIRQPRVLLLDEVCAGLDAPSRNSLKSVLRELAGNGIQLVATAHREEDFPPGLTHILHLQNGRITETLPFPTPSVDSHATTIESLRHPGITHGRGSGGELQVAIRGASVYVDGTRALHNLNWEIREGDHWLVSGPNGSGKSTLLRLILGELLPEYGGYIQRFLDGQPVPVNVFRDRIGYVSAALQDVYQREMTAREVIASGFFASVGLVQTVASCQWRRVAETMNRFGIAGLAERHFGKLSYGQRRKILLARALVNCPKLLLLDEPFDGLDRRSRADIAWMLKNIAKEDISIVLVTHHSGDALPLFNYHQCLEGGVAVPASPEANR